MVYASSKTWETPHEATLTALLSYGMSAERQSLFSDRQYFSQEVMVNSLETEANYCKRGYFKEMRTMFSYIGQTSTSLPKKYQRLRELFMWTDENTRY